MKRGRRGAARTADPRNDVAAPRDRAADAAAVLLAIVLAGTALLVDPRAAAAFDAPKRLIALLGIAAAGSIVVWRRWLRATYGEAPTGRPFVGWSAWQRVAAGALGAVLVWSTVAALASPRRAIAIDALRTLALAAVALPLGASATLDGRRGARLLGVFIACAAVNAAVSVLQGAGLELFAVAAITGRTDTGAFLGNEGHLAQVVALAAVASLTIAASARTPRTRGAAAAVSALFLVALLVNRNLTALVTLATGVGTALVVWRGRRALVPIALGLVVATAGIALYAPLRGRVAEAARSMRAGDWDAVTTYRLGPWTAALEMVRERPLTGFGPGTFGAEFVPHRLAAEIRHRQRFVIPLLTSSFGEAHSEYLQTAAEAGVPAALGLLVALAALLAAIARLAGRGGADDLRREAVVLTALLAAAAVSAVTWFPLQRPVTAVPILLAAGRAWRVLGATAAPEHGVGKRAGIGELAMALVVVALLLGAAAPELGRYAAERRLAAATARIESVAAGGRVVPAAAPMLEPFAAAASATADVMPADYRGLIAAGTARLVAGDAAAAGAHYRAALARGERAEIDLNLARAYALAGDQSKAEAALLRAAWVSPTLIATLPAKERPRLEAAVAELVTRLRDGTLATPPPLPEDAASPRLSDDATSSRFSDHAAPSLPADDAAPADP